MGPFNQTIYLTYYYKGHYNSLFMEDYYHKNDLDNKVSMCQIKMRCYKFMYQLHLSVNRISSYNYIHV
jgi:hypothetical protein